MAFQGIHFDEVIITLKCFEAKQERKAEAKAKCQCQADEMEGEIESKEALEKERYKKKVNMFKRKKK